MILKIWVEQLFFQDPADHDHCPIPPTPPPQAERPSVTSAIAAASHAAADTHLQPNDVIEVGSLRLTCLATPGHTDGCMCFYLPPGEGRSGLVFTGECAFAESYMSCSLQCVLF